MRRVSLALLIATLMTTWVGPAAAAAAVTITATSFCDPYTWNVTVSLVSRSARSVEIYDTSDQYGNRKIRHLSLAAGVAKRVTFTPGAYAQKDEVGVFPKGSLGWDHADPLAVVTVFDPIQTDPGSTC